MDFNIVILSGIVTKDLEFKEKQNGDNTMTYVRFNIAVNKYNQQTRQSTASYIPCIAFDKNAKLLRGYNVGKGSKIVVNGTISYSFKKNEQGGYENSFTVVVVSFDGVKRKTPNESEVERSEIIDQEVESILPF